MGSTLEGRREIGTERTGPRIDRRGGRRIGRHTALKHEKAGNRWKSAVPALLAESEGFEPSSRLHD